MLQGLIIENGYTRNPNIVYKEKRLQEEFLSFGVKLVVKDALDLLVSSNGEESLFQDLSSYSFAIDLDKDRYLAYALSKRMPLFNSYESMMLSDDKMMTLLALEKSGVKAPLSIAAPLCYRKNPDQGKVEQFLREVESELSYPFVYKECHGSLGMQVRLIHNHDEFVSTYLSNITVPHLYEEFLKKHAGHDYRVIVCENKVIAAMERINEKDFRSNIALGGRGVDVTSTLGSEFKEMALKASSALGLDYAGIDIGMDEKGEPRFLEANGNAFFTEIEEVSHVNIAKAFAEMVLHKLAPQK